MTHATRLNRKFAAILLPMLALATGCTSGGPSRLRLHSTGSGHLFSQDFEQSYFSQTSSGEYEVVLVDNGARQRAQRGDKPLKATDAAPLRQVVAIRIHWRPAQGTRADSPSATNAVVDWYVLADSVDQTQDRLHYQGAAFVRIFPNDKTARIVVRNGSLSLLEASGALRDPVGESTIEGDFVAKRNETMVAAVTTPIRMESLARIRTAGAKQPPSGRAAGGQ